MRAAIKQEARELLGSARLRRTNPRVVILGALLGADKPLAQEQIAARLGGERPDRPTGTGEPDQPRSVRRDASALLQG